jgi:hypothetical protein
MDEEQNFVSSAHHDGALKIGDVFESNKHLAAAVADKLLEDANLNGLAVTQFKVQRNDSRGYYVLRCASCTLPMLFTRCLYNT